MIGLPKIPVSFSLVQQVLISVSNGKAIADRPRQRDNFRTEGGQGAAKGGQLTVKDDSGAKIPKGPKKIFKETQII